MDTKTLREQLAAIDQQQVLRFFDRIDQVEKQKLVRELEALDLDEIDELAEKHVRHKSSIALPKNIQPVQMYPHRPGAGQERLYADAIDRGNNLVRQAKVAAFLVAGGQGTRLGYDGPKG